MTEVSIEKLKQGDNTAFKELFDDLFHHVRFFCERIVNDEDQAEDIAIESFIKFWQNSSRLNSFNDIKAFIYVTAKNACFNYLERKKVQERYVRSLVASPGEEEQLLAERYINEAAMLEKLYREVENLPSRCKETFKLYYFERLSRKEIAEKLSISLNTVNLHCANAIQKLRLIFSEKDLHTLLLIIVLQVA